MSPRFSQIALFLALFIALPLPMLGLDGVRVPAARFVQLGGSMLGLWAVEGGVGVEGSVTALLVTHAVVYTASLAGLVWALWRFVLSRFPHRFRDHVTVISVTLLILIGAYDELYETGFHHTSAHAQLFELYR